MSQIQLESMLNEGEEYVRGEEKHRRLKVAEHIRLDPQILQTFWENKKFIPESWKKKVNGYTCYIFFDGLLLRNPHGYRYVLCLYWGDGEWSWCCSWLDDAVAAHASFGRPRKYQKALGRLRS